MIFKSSKINKIIKKHSGEMAIMKIESILSPIFNSNVGKLTEPELNFCLIEELEAEINSGGFESYFYNSYGNNALNTVNALNLVGSTVFKSILINSMNAFKSPKYPNIQEDRISLIDANDEEYNLIWNQLDTEFYSYSENLHELLLTYVKNNIDQFR